LSDDLAALVDHLGLGQFALAGESGGGPYALAAALRLVHLWHCALDTNAPIATARQLAREVPAATLHVSDSSQHDVGNDRSEEIMSVIASYRS
jgi:hypothetical protein